MSCIVLRRVEQQPGESEIDFISRVLCGFRNAAVDTADAAVGEGATELYKRGRADGMKDMAALYIAVVDELRARREERLNSGSANLN